MRKLTIALVLIAAAMFAPRRAQAQLPIPSLSLMGGVSSFHLSGTGTTPMAALRLDIPLLVLVAEGSLGVLRPQEQSGTHTYIVPEAQLQWQIFPLLVRPYLGVGGGWFRAVSGPGEHRNDLTLSASAGVRFSIPLIGAGLRAEARVRGIGSGFSGSATELMLGVSW
jgi:hypothetical protein